MEKLDKRDYSIDLIKTWAIIGVIVIHVCSSFLTFEKIGSFNFLVSLFYGSLFRSSVPLFLMATGSLFLNSEKELSLKKLYLKSIPRLIVAMLFWGMLYKIYHLDMQNALTFSNVIYSFKRLILFDHEFHLYYIDIVLILYIFLPVVRTFCTKAQKKDFIYVLLLWTVLGIIYPTIRLFKPFSLLLGMTNEWQINLTYSSLGFAILGHFLKRYPLSLKWGIGFLLSGFLMTFIMTLYLSYQDGILNEYFLWGTSPGVYLLAIGFFLVSHYIKINSYFKRCVTYISKASFLIYLSHMFVLYELGDLLKIPLFIYIPLMAVFTLFICLILYAIISKMPVLKKWII